MEKCLLFVLLAIFALGAASIGGLIAGPLLLSTADDPMIYKDRCRVGACSGDQLLVHPASMDAFPNSWFPARIFSCSDLGRVDPADGTIACYVQRVGAHANDLRVTMSLPDRTIGICLMVASWPVLIGFLSAAVFVVVRARRTAQIAVAEEVRVTAEDGPGDSNEELAIVRRSVLADRSDAYARLRICAVFVVAFAVVFAVPAVITGAITTHKSMAASVRDECSVAWCVGPNVAVIETALTWQAYSFKETVQLDRCARFVGKTITCFVSGSGDLVHLTTRRTHRFDLGLAYLISGSVVLFLLLIALVVHVQRTCFTSQ